MLKSCLCSVDVRVFPNNICCVFFISRMLFVLLYPFPCVVLVFSTHITLQLCLYLFTALFNDANLLAIAFGDEF